MPLTDRAIQVLVVDDHPVVRMGLVAALSLRTDIQVVGEAKDLPELLQAVRATKPDVVVLDLSLEHGSEFDALRVLRKEHPAIRVIIYTAHDEAELIVEAVELGIQGYLLKSADSTELIAAIDLVHNGGTTLQPAVAAKLMQQLRRSRHGTTDRAAVLSPRELDVLRLMAEGKSNGQIAASLFISERTVKFHVSSILSKLEAHNRTEAVLLATRQGLVNQDGTSTRPPKRMTN